MISFLTYITGFFMNFEIADFDRLCKLEKRGMKLKKILQFLFLVMAAILDTGWR
jgi:hypothetical protein